MTAMAEAEVEAEVVVGEVVVGEVVAAAAEDVVSSVATAVPPSLDAAGVAACTLALYRPMCSS